MSNKKCLNYLLIIFFAISQIVFSEVTTKANTLGFSIFLQDLKNEQDSVLDKANLLSNKITALTNAGKYDEALRVSEELLTIKKNILGSEHLDVASLLSMMGEIYYVAGNFNKAGELFENALVIREKLLPEFHIDIGETYNNLSTICVKKLELDKAEEFIKKALTIYESNFGRNNLDTAIVINNLGLVYFYQENFSEAISLYEEALRITETKDTLESTKLINILNNLALANYAEGNYKDAEVFYRRSLNIAEKNFGSQNINLVIPLNNLGELYYTVNDYINAEKFYKKSLDIVNKVFGINHINGLNIYRNLGLLHYKKGDYDNAENFYNIALEIAEKNLGTGNPEVAPIINSLGEIYYKQGEEEKAERYYLKAIEQLSNSNARSNSILGRFFSNLAILYYNKGNYVKAEALFEKALNIQKKTYGNESIAVAQTMNNLGLVYRQKQKYSEAEDLYKKSLEIYQTVFNLRHSDSVGVLNNLVEINQIKGEMEKALKYKILASAIRENDLATNLLSGSEEQKIKYLALTEDEKDKTLSFHLQFLPKNEEACKIALNTILSRKTRSLDVMRNTLFLLRSQNKEYQDLFDDLRKTQEKIIALIFKGIGKEGKENYVNKLKRLENKLEELENELTKQVFGFKQLISNISIEEIQDKIPYDSVMIEFVKYRPYNVKTQTYDPDRYVAYLLEKQGSPKFVELGEADLIDDKIIEFRDLLIKKQGKPVSDVETQIKPKGQDLYKLIIKSICNLVKEKKHLIIVPDGLLNTIPFESFVDGEQKYLVESYEISYLTSGKDLIRFENEITTENPPVLVADPFYGDGSGPVVGGNQYNRLEKLPGSAKEVTEIKSILPNAKVFLGKDATKQIIKNLNRPSILHIATHSYFLPDPVIKTNVMTLSNNEKALVKTENTRNLTIVTGGELRLSNPLLRAYLFFAGANENDENGLLTALELGIVDLTGTKLVVLSGCDTGLGEIKNWQGVYGLKRALILAGSQTQMITLWEINDEFTAKFMTNYYKLVKSGESRCRALRKVQIDCLNEKFSGKTKQFSHPYYWASFVLSGKWSNLE